VIGNVSRVHAQALDLAVEGLRASAFWLGEPAGEVFLRDWREPVARARR
jgi:hypothetical protein